MEKDTLCQSPLEQLISHLEAEVAAIAAGSRASEPAGDQWYAGYTSVIKCNGVPILPPLMTKERCEEMQLYRHQAMMVEARLQASSRNRLLARVQQIMDRLENRKVFGTCNESVQSLCKNITQDLSETKFAAEMPKLPVNSAQGHAMQANYATSPRSQMTEDSGICSALSKLRSPSPNRMMYSNDTNYQDTLKEIPEMPPDDLSQANVLQTIDGQPVTMLGVAVSPCDESEHRRVVDQTISPGRTVSPDRACSVSQRKPMLQVNDLRQAIQISKSSSSSNSEDMNRTVIGRDEKQCRSDPVVSAKDGNDDEDTLSCHSEPPILPLQLQTRENCKDVDTPRIVEINTPRVIPTESRQSQTYDDLQDSLEDSLVNSTCVTAAVTDQSIDLQDSLELGATLLSRVALSDNEDNNDSDEDTPKTEYTKENYTHKDKRYTSQENDEDTNIDFKKDVLAGLTSDHMQPSKTHETASTQQAHTKNTVSNTTSYHGNNQKLMVLQKLNSLLEHVNKKNIKTKSVLKSPDRNQSTGVSVTKDVLSPGPRETPDVSHISCVDEDHLIASAEYSPVKSSSVIPKPAVAAVSPYPQVGSSPTVAAHSTSETYKSVEIAMHTASTELDQYMAASTDTANSLSTLHHSTNSHKTQHLSYTTPPDHSYGPKKDNYQSPVVLPQSRNVQKSDSPSDRVEVTVGDSYTSSMEGLKLRPVQRKLQYDNESTPPKTSVGTESAGKQEHLQRYLDQVAQPEYKSPAQQSVTPQSSVLEQMKYFEQMKEHMMLQHRQQLGHLLAEQQRQQLIMQQQFLQQEHMLQQQLTWLSSRDSRSSSATVTPDLAMMTMPLLPPDLSMGLASRTMNMTAPPCSLQGSASGGFDTSMINTLTSSPQRPVSAVTAYSTNAGTTAPPPSLQSGGLDTSMISSIVSPQRPVFSPRVAFSMDQSVTPSRKSPSGVQVHYYTPEHSSPPSPEFNTVLRRPVPDQHTYIARMVSPDDSRRQVKMNLESLSDDVLHKFDRVTAAVRGYLTRRLLRTQKVQQIITTIRDTAIFALSFQEEGPIKQGLYSSQDRILQDRVLAQLTAAMYEINEIFIQTSVAERMAVIASDRQLLREKFFKEQKQSAEKKVSEATKKAMERKKRARLAEKAMLEHSFRAKSAPPSARSPRSPRGKVEDHMGPIRRNYQFIMSRAMPKSARPRRSGVSPLKPVKENLNRAVAEGGKAVKKENFSTKKSNSNTKRTNNSIVRKTITLSDKIKSGDQAENKGNGSILSGHSNLPIPIASIDTAQMKHTGRSTTPSALRQTNTQPKPTNIHNQSHVQPQTHNKAKTNSPTPWK